MPTACSKRCLCAASLRGEESSCAQSWCRPLRCHNLMVAGTLWNKLAKCSDRAYPHLAVLVIYRLLVSSTQGCQSRHRSYEMQSLLPWSGCLSRAAESSLPAKYTRQLQRAQEKCGAASSLQTRRASLPEDTSAWGCQVYMHLHAKRVSVDKRSELEVCQPRWARPSPGVKPSDPPLMGAGAGASPAAQFRQVSVARQQRCTQACQ